MGGLTTSSSHSQTITACTKSEWYLNSIMIVPGSDLDEVHKQLICEENHILRKENSIKEKEVLIFPLAELTRFHKTSPK